MSLQKPFMNGNKQVITGRANIVNKESVIALFIIIYKGGKRKPYV